MPIITGIIGYGNMGKWHSDTIRSCPQFRLEAVHDIRPERNRRAEEAIAVTGYDDLQSFLNHPGLELVVIATPNDVHMPLSCAAMEASKHVICEKPVAMDLQQLDYMIETSRKCGVLFTVHHNRRWDGDYLTIKKAFSSNSIGEVFDIQSRCVGWSTGEMGWRGIAKHGGGMLYDWGIHLLDQMVDLVGAMPNKVFAAVANLRGYEVDDYFKVQLLWESGLTAEVEFSPRHACPMPRWILLGNKGSIVFRDWGSGSIWLTDGEKVMEEKTLPMEKTDWRDYYATGIYSAIRKGEPLRVPPESVRPVMMIIDACRRSAEKGEAVSFN